MSWPLSFRVIVFSCRALFYTSAPFFAENHFDTRKARVERQLAAQLTISVKALSANQDCFQGSTTICQIAARATAKRVLGQRDGINGSLCDLTSLILRRSHTNLKRIELDKTSQRYRKHLIYFNSFKISRNNFNLLSSITKL